MSKKIDRSAQNKNISEQIAKATKSVSVLTSQQDATVVATSSETVLAEEKVITDSVLPASSVVVTEELSEKKTLRGAASPNYKRKKKEMVLISARIDKQMEDEIDRICEKENMSKTDIITFALDYVLNSYKMRKLFLGRNSFIENIER